MNLAAHSERESRILSLWERAVGRSRWDREDALLADAGRPQGLGDRNRALLALRAALFGRDWQLGSDCPDCGFECEFTADAIALADGLAAPNVDRGSVECQGRAIGVRAPTFEDLQAAAAQGDVASGAQALLARCLLAEVDLAQLNEEDIEKIELGIENLDQAAIVTFALACPDCGHEWTSPLDVGNALWAELVRAAELSFLDIDALARAYGWTEDQITSLSPMRRAAYVQLVAAS